MFGLKMSIWRWKHMMATKNSFAESRVDSTNIQNLQYAPVAGLTRLRRTKSRNIGRLNVNWIKLTINKTNKARFCSWRKWIRFVMKNAKMQRKRIMAGICNKSMTINLRRWRMFVLFDKVSILLMIIVELEIRIFKLHGVFICQEWSLFSMRSLSFFSLIHFLFSCLVVIFLFYILSRVFCGRKHDFGCCIRLISTINQNFNGTLLRSSFLSLRNQVTSFFEQAAFN